jgi:hypothetical protein
MSTAWENFEHWNHNDWVFKYRQPWIHGYMSNCRLQGGEVLPKDPASLIVQIGSDDNNYWMIDGILVPFPKSNYQVQPNKPSGQYLWLCWNKYEENGIWKDISQVFRITDLGDTPDQEHYEKIAKIYTDADKTTAIYNLLPDGESKRATYLGYQNVIPSNLYKTIRPDLTISFNGGGIREVPLFIWSQDTINYNLFYVNLKISNLVTSWTIASSTLTIPKFGYTPPFWIIITLADNGTGVIDFFTDSLDWNCAEGLEKNSFPIAYVSATGEFCSLRNYPIITPADISWCRRPDGVLPAGTVGVTYMLDAWITQDTAFDTGWISTPVDTITEIPHALNTIPRICLLQGKDTGGNIHQKLGSKLTDNNCYISLITASKFYISRGLYDPDYDYSRVTGIV